MISNEFYQVTFRKKTLLKYERIAKKIWMNGFYTIIVNTLIKVKSAVAEYHMKQC